VSCRSLDTARLRLAVASVASRRDSKSGWPVIGIFIEFFGFINLFWSVRGWSVALGQLSRWGARAMSRGCEPRSEPRFPLPPRNFFPIAMGFLRRVPVRATQGRLSALSVLLFKSVFYGAFVWARRALNSQKRRFPARAVHRRCAHAPSALAGAAPLPSRRAPRRASSRSARGQRCACRASLQRRRSRSSRRSPRPRRRSPDSGR
jgi:hypothetical protein